MKPFLFKNCFKMVPFHSLFSDGRVFIILYFILSFFQSFLLDIFFFHVFASINFPLNSCLKILEKLPDAIEHYRITMSWWPHQYAFIQYPAESEKICSKPNCLALLDKLFHFLSISMHVKAFILVSLGSKFPTPFESIHHQTPQSLRVQSICFGSTGDLFLCQIFWMVSRENLKFILIRKTTVFQKSIGLFL